MPALSTPALSMIARHRRRLLPAIAALTLVGSAGDDPRPARITAAAAASGFAGEILVGEGDRIVIDRSFGLTVPRPAGAAAPDGGFAPGAAWPWASVTKQVVATLVMQQVADGRIALDVPAGRYLPLLAGKVAGPTVRQLLQHRAGLRNPDDTPVGPNGFPAYYTARYPTLGWCLGGRKAAGGKWRYNNCDYVVLGALLQQVTGQTVPALYAERIARPLGLHAQFVAPDDLLRLDWPGGGGVTADERPVFARFGAAGGLAGTARDLVTFDQALLHGRLLPAAARAEMWRGDPGLGFEALGQWSFDAKLKGCPTPVKIIERRGGIGRFQARNILLPDQDMSIVIFTNRGDFDFGEVWQGKGFSYDLLSAAACP